MSRVDQSRQSRSDPPARRAVLAASALALALAGCAGGPAKDHDPMLGILGTPSPAPADGTGAATAPASAAAVPPLPATHTITSPAALAGGATPAPEGAREMRIPGGAPVVPTSLPGNSAARGAAPANNVQIGEPQPAGEMSSSRLLPVAAPAPPPPPAAAATSAPPPPAGTPSGAMTFEQAQQFLKQRGVTWQRLETWGDQGQWKFQCSLPIPGSTNMNRTYATDTPLPYDPLTAVRAVLDKIEKDQQR